MCEMTKKGDDSFLEEMKKINVELIFGWSFDKIQFEPFKTALELFKLFFSPKFVKNHYWAAQNCFWTLQNCYWINQNCSWTA